MQWKSSRSLSGIGCESGYLNLGQTLKVTRNDAFDAVGIHISKTSRICLKAILKQITQLTHLRRTVGFSRASNITNLANQRQAIKKPPPRLPISAFPPCCIPSFSWRPDKEIGKSLLAREELRRQCREGGLLMGLSRDWVWRNRGDGGWRGYFEEGVR